MAYVGIKRCVVAMVALGVGIPGAYARPRTPPAAAPAPAPAAGPKVALDKAKRALAVAVRLCDAPGRCEPGSRTADGEYVTMLKDAERNFMTACERCATHDRCDQERERIRSGKRSPDGSPCE